MEREINGVNADIFKIAKKLEVQERKRVEREAAARAREARRVAAQAAKEAKKEEARAARSTAKAAARETKSTRTAGKALFAKSLTLVDDLLVDIDLPTATGVALEIGKILQDPAWRSNVRSAGEEKCAFWMQIGAVQKGPKNGAHN